MRSDQSDTPAPENRAQKKGIRLSADEAWEVLESSHTGIFASLRRDGVPIMLPVWFVVINRRIYLRTASESKKARRIRKDPRASFLVESGERWAELRAVHLTGRIEEIHDESLIAKVDALFDDQYARFRTPAAKMGDGTRAYYARDRSFFEFVPDERILSWDNHRLGLA